MTSLSYNRLRWSGSDEDDLVESYFIRANEPGGRRAIWLKATVLTGRGRAPRVALWWVVFDGDSAVGGRLEDAGTSGVSSAGVRLADGYFETDGQLGSASGSDAAAGAQWSLSWTPAEDDLAAPMTLFPFARMLSGGFPKSKLVTPAPLLRISGSYRVGDAHVCVDGWRGMQGHNWGREHAPEYAWGHAWFGDERPQCIVEGFTARTRIARVLTPPLSCLIVRTRTREFRFDRFWRLGSHRGTINGDGSWNLDMSNSEARASLWMRASPEQSACLRYENPNGDSAYCFNSKTARARLWLQTNDGTETLYRSDQAALEFLSGHPDARYGSVI